MKKIFLSLLILMSTMALHAQYMYHNNDNNDNSDENEGGGFRKDHVFIGGALSLGFGSGSFNVGGNPEIGYSVAKWLDAGVIFNINYFSQTYYNGDGSTAYKASSFNYGGGAFLRAYPLPFLFLSLQPEYNWIDYTTKYPSGDVKQNVSAGSLIGAIGYGQRVVGQGSYFFSIGLDLLRNAYSPYLDGYGNPYPIIRGGFDIYLKPSKKPKPSGPEL